MKKYFDKGLSQLGKANAFFSQRGEEAETPIDISNLSPEDAIAQLQVQNKDVIAKNRQLKASSDKNSEENGLLKQQLVDLRTYVKEVEQDRATTQDRYHRTQMQHKQSLEQLQEECDNMAQQMKDSQGENHVLQGEVTDLRFKLMMAGSEASGVPENTIQEWQAQKERMQSQLQAAQEKYFEMQRREKAASDGTGTALDMAKLQAVETELEDSKSQVSQLTERCEELQKQVESLQTESPGPGAVTGQHSGTPLQSAFTGTVSVSLPREGEGWGDGDASCAAWDDKQNTEPQQLAVSSDKQPSRADGGNGKQSTGSEPADATAVTSALRALLQAGRECGTEPGVVKDVLTLLSEYGVAVEGMGNNSSDTSRVPPVRIAHGAVPGWPGGTRYSEDNTGPTLHSGSTLASIGAADLCIALSPVNTHRVLVSRPSISSDAGQETKETCTDSNLSPGTAELFDAVGAATGTASTPPHITAEAAKVKLQLPLIAWDSFSAVELSRYLQILSAVSCAVSGDRQVSSLSLQAQSKTGDGAADSASTAVLQAHVRAAEDALVSSCSELAQVHLQQNQLQRTRSSQRSTLRTMSGPHRRLSGDAAAAPDTPVSDTGSPGLPSMSTLNKILQELLSEHASLLLQCSEGGSENAEEHRRALQNLATAAETELQRLQALQSQQQDEVSIQWNEKQQLQSAAQNEIARGRQELAVTQQENEMLRAQLEELESAHEQVTCERDNLHQQTQQLHHQMESHTHIMSSPSALQDLATVQMMPRLDLGSDSQSTLTPTSTNNQSTPHDTSAQALVAERSGGTAVALPTEELSESPENATRQSNGELRGRHDVPPLVSTSNAAATLHQAHRLSVDLRAAREQCGVANRAAQEANQRAETLQGQLVDVTAERDDLLAGIDQIEEVASARIQQDEEMVERLMIAEGQLEERTSDLEVARGQCAVQEEQLAELRKAMSELQVCVEGARQSALQQEAELSDLRSQVAVAVDNGTAAVSDGDSPVKSDADVREGAGAQGESVVGAEGPAGCGASGEDATVLHVRVEEAESAAAAAHAKHDEAVQLLEAEKRQVEEATVRYDAQQQEVASLQEAVADLRKSAEAQQAELSSVQEELAAAKENLESVQDEKALLDEALEGAQRQLESRQKEATEATEKLADVEKEAAQLRQDKAVAEKQLQTASAGAAASQAELERAVEGAQNAEAALEAQHTAHSNALEELRLQHVSEIEDVKTQASEKLKSGTSDLQKALKNAQAQLQAVGADKAATTAKAAQEVESLKKELQAREQQLESTQGSLAQLQTSNEEQARDLRAKIDTMAAAAKKEASKLQSDVDSMNKKLEHLQKVNKEKRQELEELYIEHGTVQSSASAAESKAEKVTRDLADARKRIEELTNKLSQQEVAMKELSEVKNILAKAPGTSKDLALVSQTQTVMNVQLEAMLSMAQSATKLLEETTVLRESATEGKQLRGEMLNLSSRAAEDAAATKRLQQQLAQTISDLTASQDQLQVFRAELQRVQKQAKKDRVRYDTEMSKSDRFLDSLPANDVTQWPEPVKTLVAAQVSAAVEDARSVLQGEAETAVDDLEEQLEGLQQQLAESKSTAAALSEQLSVSQEQSQHLETELMEQEVAMQAQIADLQAQLQQANAGESVEDGLEAERRGWQGKCAELTIQISELRQKLQASRAQAMLALKEKQDEIPIRYHSGGGSQVMASLPEILSEFVPDTDAHVPPVKDVDGLVPEESLSTTPTREGVTDYWKRRCNDLQKEVDLLQNDLADQMHVHELRDLADGAKAQEIQELQAVKSRSSVDVEYLKNIMIGFFEAGQLPHNEQVLVVLDRLLSFTEVDRRRIRKQRQADKGIVASLFGA